MDSDPHIRFKLPGKRTDDQPSILQLSWVVTLSLYTGSNEVLFETAVMQPVDVGRAAPLPNFQPLQIRLQPQKTVAEELQSIQAQTSLSCQSGNHRNLPTGRARVCS